MMLSFLSLLYFFRALADGMRSSTLEVDLPVSVKPFWKYYHRHIQNCISTQVLNPIKLKINHHTYYVPNAGHYLINFYPYGHMKYVHQY